MNFYYLMFLKVKIESKLRFCFPKLLGYSHVGKLTRRFTFDFGYL